MSPQWLKFKRTLIIKSSIPDVLYSTQQQVSSEETGSNLSTKPTEKSRFFISYKKDGN